MSTMTERVEAGVAWLDDKRPDWRERVEAERLDMSDGCDCVCGQAFAQCVGHVEDARNGYMVACSLGVPGRGPITYGARDRWAEDHGFTYNGKLDIPADLQERPGREMSLTEMVEWDERQDAATQAAWKALDELWRLALAGRPLALA